MRAALALIAISLAVPATAQDGGAARYQLQRIEGGYARIDTATGEVSTCTETRTETGAQLVCRMAADERGALEDQIAALEVRVEALEAGGAARALPSDAEIDRAIGMMERFMRGFVGVVRDLDEPRRPDEPRS